MTLPASALATIRSQEFAYNFQNEPHQFHVPAEVTSLTIEAFGAPGATSSNAVSGRGGKALNTNVKVTPESDLEVVVGGPGEEALSDGTGGGYNGGGGAGGGAGGGGGGSDVRSGSCAKTLICGPTSIIFAAGGGGGGSSSGPSGGSGGGLEGAKGGSGNPENGGHGGGGGSQIEGGVGGAGGVASGGGTAPAGTKGEQGRGGSGAHNGCASGGGGGGFWGGGGGGSSGGNGCGGGGGGSGTGPSGTTYENGVWAEASGGKVIISYTETKLEEEEERIAQEEAEKAQREFCEQLLTEGEVELYELEGCEAFLEEAKPPTVTLSTPSEGASYTLGEVVDASYSCKAGEGSSLSSCNGTAVNGAAIDTGSVGSKSFSVTAKDADGQEATVTHKYSVGKATPTVKSSPSGSILVGGSETDGVTVTGNATGKNPTGSVKFLVCAKGTDPCSSGGSQVGNAVSLAAGSGNTASTTSESLIPSEGPGTYCFRAEYQGDGNYNAGSDGSAGECFTVGKATPTAKSTPSGSILVGGSETDGLTVTGNATGKSPTGKAKFFACAKGINPCSSGGTQVGASVSLTAGAGNASNATSESFTPSEGPGSYCLRAEYEGDANYNVASDGSAGECFAVGKATAAVESTPSGEIGIGGSETDAVTITGNATGKNPTGKATFFACSKGTNPCSSGGTQVGVPVSLTAGAGNASNATSEGFSPSEGLGTYCFRVEYEGDGNYNAGSDGSAGECFTVGKASPAVKSTPSGEIALGGSETDGVTVTGNATGKNPTGSVKFLVCAKGTNPCSSGGSQVGNAVSLAAGAGNTASTTSEAFTPSEGPGTYCLRAEYQGDGNYNVASDGSAGECFTMAKATPTVKSTPSGEIALGGSETDGATVTGNSTGKNPTGSVKFIACARGTNPCSSGGSQVGNAVSLAAGAGNTASTTSEGFTPSEGPGTYCLRAEYQGDGNYNAASDGSAGECFTVAKATPTAKSTPSGSIVVGGSETDGMTVTGNATGKNPTGSVKFIGCAKGINPCSSGGTQIGASVSLAAGAGNSSNATSEGFTPSEGPGTYCLRAEYQGDGNYNASSDGSAGECFTVGKATPTVKSTPSGEIAVGGSETDGVTVTGNSAGKNPTGSVEFLVCAKGTNPCSSGGSQVGNAVSLGAGAGNTASTTSESLIPSEGPGTYCFRAEYQGDANYNAASDGSAGECFTVAKATPTVQSTPSGEIAVGGSETDGVTVTGNSTGKSPTGKAKFFACAKGINPCSSGGTQVGASVSLTAGSGNASNATSEVFSPSEGPGTYCLRAEYQGDSNYNIASDGSAGECFAVGKASPTIKSTPSGSIVVGGSETDGMTVTGNATGKNPTGSVKFLVCAKGTNPCSSGGSQVGNAVSLAAGAGNTAATTSEAFTPSEGPGTYCLRAEYQGDANYNVASDGSAGECFTVGKAPVTIKSTPSGPILVGGSETDGVTVTGNATGKNPTGSVKFLVCAKGTNPCSSGGSQVGNAVSLGAGAGNTASNTSEALTPTEGPGTYCLRAEYQGDANYNVASDGSAGECFTVAKATPAVESTPSGTISVGASETDEVAVQGNGAGGSPSGSVKFFLCAVGSEPCESGGTQIENAVVLTAGASDESNATSASFTPSEGPGTYCLRAEYEGDANYNAATDGSAGECFTVGKATPAVKSTPSGEIAVGGSETDGVTVTGNSTGGSPSGSIEFFLCAKGTNPCSSGGSHLGAVTSLKAGGADESSATSESFIPSEGPGTYCMRADYGGDANYNAGSDGSAGECFTLGAAASMSSSKPDSASLTLGSSDTDHAVVDGNAVGGSPTGSVTFSACGPLTSASGCALGAGTAVGTGPVALTAGSADSASADSAAFTPTSPGTWCFAAAYGGDPNYQSSSDTSPAECFTVAKAASTLTSTPASPASTLAGSDSDEVLVSGNTTGGAPTGAVTFFICGPLPSAAGCASGSGTMLGSAPVTLTGSGTDTATASSANFTATSPGTWCIRAEYAGDTNYTGSSDSGSGECFTVPTPAPPTVSISAPVNGALLSLDQVLHASFSCADSAGATGIASCVGTVADGAPIDTSKPGSHTFTVTATSKDGQSTTAIATYTVNSATLSPAKFEIVSVTVVHHRQLNVLVKVPGAGRVDAIATHALGSLAHSDSLHPGSSRFAYDLVGKKTTSAGEVTLKLKPNKTGLRLLRKLSHPRLRITVSFEVAGQATMELVRSVRL